MLCYKNHNALITPNIKLDKKMKGNSAYTDAVRKEQSREKCHGNCSSTISL